MCERDAGARALVRQCPKGRPNVWGYDCLLLVCGDNNCLVLVQKVFWSLMGQRACQCNLAPGCSGSCWKIKLSGAWVGSGLKTHLVSLVQGSFASELRPLSLLAPSAFGLG